MAPAAYLASAVLMGVLALGVLVFVAKGRPWHAYRPRLGRPEGSQLARLARDSRVWTIAFFALIFGATAATLAVLSGASPSIVLGGTGALILGFTVIGVYAMGRSRGHPHAFAVGEAVITLGVVFLVALTGWLVASFGA